MTVLRPMSDSEYAAWVPDAIASYAADKVASGQWSAAESLARSTKEHEELLPQGLSTLDNNLYTVADDEGNAVGVLWFAVKTRFGSRIAYVFAIEIKPGHRRQGHGCRALLALEQEVRRLGLSGIALHVFGHNKIARELYARLGFEPTNINLFKPIRTAQAES